MLRADVSLGPDNRSRGYGNVLMGSREDAARAIGKLRDRRCSDSQIGSTDSPGRRAHSRSGQTDCRQSTSRSRMSTTS